MNKYTESLFYEVTLTGKYIKKAAEQHLKNLKVEFTGEEFSALDIIYESTNICQRDLALRMLINRANMGKILNGLEKRGLIERKLTQRCSHPVKYISLTDLGKEVYLKARETLKENTGSTLDIFSEDEISFIISSLQKLRRCVKDITQIDI
ncbi:MAG: MarR family transcriptional regulator [Candidatus Gastranaerophilales bacterium]|nr:MarR family transcriptional regulator [Candidatus Gastranaerophilales bacterium]